MSIMATFSTHTHGMHDGGAGGAGIVAARRRRQPGVGRTAKQTSVAKEVIYGSSSTATKGRHGLS